MMESFFRTVVLDADGSIIQPWTLPATDGTIESARAAQRAWNGSLTLDSLHDPNEKDTYIVAHVQALDHYGWRNL